MMAQLAKVAVTATWKARKQTGSRGCIHKTKRGNKQTNKKKHSQKLGISFLMASAPTQPKYIERCNILLHKVFQIINISTAILSGTVYFRDLGKMCPFWKILKNSGNFFL